MRPTEHFLPCGLRWDLSIENPPKGGFHLQINDSLSLSLKRNVRKMLFVVAPSGQYL